MAEIEDEASRTFLKDPLILSDLIAGGSMFEINSNFNEPDASVMDELNFGSDDEQEDDDLVLENLVSPWTKPFNELKESMQELNEHLYKRVTRESKVGGARVSKNARVCLRYNAYWEGESTPFDSSFLRGANFSFYTGREEVLPGLEQAVLTMQSGEEAQFVISYQLLFGEMGCPPRVKKRADGLFIIEIMAFNEIGDVNADAKVASEDRRKYAIISDKVKEIHLKALDFFKQGLYRNACRAFEKAVDCLNFCQLANEQEQVEQEALLVKLNTNLAVCYNKINQPGKTCIVLREIRRLTANNPPCKALFQEGRALHMLGEYEHSRQILQRALKLEPQNSEISQELKLLDKRYANYKESSKSIWSKAFGIIKDHDNVPTIETSLSTEFENEISKLIESFQKNATISEFKLPTGLTPQEVDTVEKLAERMQLKLNVVYGEDTTYSLSKQT